MVKLSTKPRYGIRILAQIAVDSEQNKQPVSGKTIAQQQNISAAYIEQILIPMRNAELVRTIRGRSGGYLLNRPAEEITLLEIIELFEGRLELVDTRDEEEDNPTVHIWNHLSEVVRKEAAAITVADVAEILRNKPSKFVNNFMI